ncbi:MAG: pepsin/retropepsin-like aspartic protease family protein [Rhizomicrobium sp.]
MASLDMTILPDGKFAVPVEINGTQHKFMVDTAGIFSRLAESSAQKMNLKTTPTEMELYGVGGKIRMSSADIESFKLGNNEARHFHLGVGGFGSNGSEVDGILSQDLLTLFDIELDFVAKKMNLFSPKHCPGKVVYWTQSGYAELPFKFTSGVINSIQHIDMDISLDDHDLTTDFDTGSASTWLRYKAAKRTFDLDENSAGVTRSPLSTQDQPAYRKQFGLLKIGGVQVRNPAIDIIPDQFDEAFKWQHSEKSRDDPIYGSFMSMEPLTFGMDVISKLHTYISFKEHKIYVTAADAH